MMEPMEITFKLASPLLIDSEFPIHFDAIMAFAVSRDAENQGSLHPWEDAFDLSDILDHTQDDGNGVWVWKASQIMVTQRHMSPQLYDMANATRRTDQPQFYDDLEAEYWQPRSTLNPATYRIKTRKGQQRAYQMYVATASISEMKAWAVGDIEAVRYYLDYIAYLGKGGKNGYGKVAKRTVLPCADEAQWRLRWMPEGAPGKPGTVYAPVYGCLRQPYWERHRYHPVMEPLF
jgi:CRISPR type IV-associated protein Csf3